MLRFQKSIKKTKFSKSNKKSQNNKHFEYPFGTYLHNSGKWKENGTFRISPGYDFRFCWTGDNESKPNMEDLRKTKTNIINLCHKNIHGIWKKTINFIYVYFFECEG